MPQSCVSVASLSLQARGSVSRVECACTIDPVPAHGQQQVVAAVSPVVGQVVVQVERQVGHQNICPPHLMGLEVVVQPEDCCPGLIVGPGHPLRPCYCSHSCPVTTLM